jgi:hypothetical protein
MGTFNKKIVLAVASLAACGMAAASEDYDLRYAPGIGGADMSAPFEAGWVFQAPAYVYSGHIRATTVRPTDLTSIGSPVPGTATTTIHTNTQINVWGTLPRLSYMSSVTFLGATLGGTALLPILMKENHSSVTGVSTTLSGPASTLLPPSAQTGLANLISGAAAQGAAALTSGNTNSAAGLGDLEVSPILRWSTDTSQTLAVLTVVAPTGDYRPERAANPSAGHFWTLRPALQYSYIGDGWDGGARVAYSMNTTNSYSHYHTGNYVNVDAMLMKSISDSTRIGVSAYGVDQTTRDSRNQVPTDPVVNARQEATLGQKGHVAGVGPEFAYIHGAGDFLLDGRAMKEFSASARPEGYTVILTLSKPF